MIPAASQTGLQLNMRHFRKGVVFMANYTYDDIFEVDTSKHGTGGALNMRQYARTSSQLVCTIPQGYPLDCDKEQEKNNWMPCTYDGARGFVMSKFLVGTKAYGTQPTSGAGNYNGSDSLNCKATVRVSNLPLYSSDDETSTVLKKIPNGATIYVNTSMVAMKEWLRAVYSNTMGFVKHKNIEVYPKNTSYVVSACQRYGAPLLKKGMTSDYVGILSQDLRNAGWHTMTGGTTFNDEIYQIVREFQSEYGLSVDGVVGNATKEKLYSITMFG